MSFSFNDDEPIPPTQEPSDQNASGKQSTTFTAGKIKQTVIKEKEAPLEENIVEVMVELTGVGSGKGRPGVDLVTVLDVSTSMKGDKIKKMKLAMQFVIKKMSSVDRLSVVTFATSSRRLCPLRPLTAEAQVDILRIVNKNVVANGNTNITAGLTTAFKVLSHRRLMDGRVSAIMLMSDGVQNIGDASRFHFKEIPDASRFHFKKIPVYTFGFGSDHDPGVLSNIANNSMGGTFSDVQNEDNLNIAFAQCLAGLLTVAAQDLKLTVKQLDSKISDVLAGAYPKTEADDSVTIFFGDLYDKEVRRVIIKLLLAAVDPSVKEFDVMETEYSYSAPGRPFGGPPETVTIKRNGKASVGKKEKVMVEGSRIMTASLMKEARVMADEENLEEAKDKLVEAQDMLEDVAKDVAVDSEPSISMLISEVTQLLGMMQTQDDYEKRGRPFAMSSETSHDRQRFATRGDVDKLRLFATPRMDAYLEQAKEFTKDPNKPLPMVEEDEEKEIAANPLGPIIGALGYYIHTAIQALKNIDTILNKPR